MKNLLKTAITSTLLFSAINLAHAGLLVEVAQYYHDLPAETEGCYDTHNCPEIDISYVFTNQEWVNKIINQKVNGFITDTDSKTYQPIKRVDYALQVPVAVQKALDEFAKGQMIDESPLAYSTSVIPAYLGHAGSLELFKISGYDFYGGAHGLGFVVYPVLDSELKKEIDLDDLIVEGKKPALSKLVEAEFDKWIVGSDMDSNPADYKQSWAFSMTDNFTFSDKGLRFVYQPYAIAPYAAGMPELTVSYDKLNGIVKSKYLQAGQELVN